MLRKFLLSCVISLLLPSIATAAFPFGVYVGNANGNDAAAMTSFKAAFDAHKAVLNGAKPKYFNVFTDFNNDPSTWAASASWAAWSSAQSGDAYIGPRSGAIPLVGVPLGWPRMGFANVDAFYLYTASGQYDAVWKGIVNAWADNGYKTVDFRIAYEMNTPFMPWSPENSIAPSAVPDFIAAFRRVADIIHQQAALRGIHAYVHWNPAAANHTKLDTTTLYPGDAYVDVISIDSYSPMYPYGYTDWSTGGRVQMTDKNAWAAIVENRRHYWRYPNATHYVQTPTLHSTGWSFPQAIEFAKLHGLPLSVDESGAGRAGSTLGPADDPEFPKFLQNILADARQEGVVVRSVSIWNAKLSDGNWNFRDGGQPLAAAAWRRYFGAMP